MGETIKIYYFRGEGDYAPVVALTDEGVLVFGDNTHFMGHEDYVNGVVAGLLLVGRHSELKSIYYEDLEDLEDYEELLKKHKVYDMFLEYFD